MLVLDRKQGEQIIIGTGPGRIVVTVVDIGRARVKIGITAPEDTAVWREEITPERDGRQDKENVPDNYGG